MTGVQTCALPISGLCFNNDGANVNSPYFISSTNQPPIADAGEDMQVLLGGNLTLDASGSSDPDGDDLTYVWVDDKGIEIPDVVSPTVMFDIAGNHTVTLTVSDGTATAEDTVKVMVISPEVSCGDNICSIAEQNAMGTDLACPQDCPVCQDSICGAGEGDSNLTELYCPIDCGIAVDIALLNATDLVVGNSTTIAVIDSITGAPVFGANITVITPNGTVISLEPVLGRAEYTFTEAGDYTISAESENYVGNTATITVKEPTNLDWVMWLIVVIVVVVLLLFFIRFINLSKKGKGRSGYRAQKYRRGKPSLSSI
mgnify:CR=1 FL=1